MLSTKGMTSMELDGDGAHGLKFRRRVERIMRILEWERKYNTKLEERGRLNM